jgi:hypothetical protein
VVKPHLIIVWSRVQIPPLALGERNGGIKGHACLIFSGDRISIKFNLMFQNVCKIYVLTIANIFSFVDLLQKDFLNVDNFVQLGFSSKSGMANRSSAVP